MKKTSILLAIILLWMQNTQPTTLLRLAPNVTVVYLVFDGKTTIGGAGGKSYLLFDVADDNMVSLATSNFFANNAKTLMLVGNTYAGINDSVAIVRDASSYWDVRTRTGPLLRLRNYDGGYDESTGAAIVLGTPFIYVAKHSGGFLYDAVNGVSWSAPVASGNTTALTGLFNLRPGRWHLYAFAVANVVVSDANLSLCVNYFKSQLGIS